MSCAARLRGATAHYARPLEGAVLAAADVLSMVIAGLLGIDTEREGS